MPPMFTMAEGCYGIREVEARVEPTQLAAPRQGIRVPSENHSPVGVRESWCPGEHDTESSYYARFKPEKEPA